MFNVIFEVHPKADRIDTYLALAGHLKPMLERSDGFIDNERFASRGRPGWVLSLSTWRDEKALVRWRTDAEHHRVQRRGRDAVFEDYHLRVGEVTFDSDAAPPVPPAQQRFDETQTAAAKAVSLTETTFTSTQAADEHARRLLQQMGRSGPADPLGGDVFQGILRPERLCLLLSWPTAAAASARFGTLAADGAAQRCRIVRVVRDYGLHDRREAPQYYPDVIRR